VSGNQQGSILSSPRESLGKRFVRECAALMTLPPTFSDVWDKQSARASFLSLMGYRINFAFVVYAFSCAIDFLLLAYATIGASLTWLKGRRICSKPCALAAFGPGGGPPTRTTKR